MGFFYWLLVAQIVLESFPISSSGHIKLLELFCTHGDYSVHHMQSVSVYVPACGPLSIDVLAHYAHGPTVVVVALFFYKRWSFLLKHWRRCWFIIGKIISLTFLADCVTALFFIGINGNFITPYFLGFGFIITALLLYSLRYCSSQSYTQWHVSTALVLGAVQGCALLPGISRLGVTYVVARWLRLAPHKAFEISLLIQWPLIVVGFLHSAYTLWVPGNWVHCFNGDIILVMAAAAVLAWYGLRLVAYMSDTRRLWWFSGYMIVPILAWAWLLLK